MVLYCSEKDLIDKLNNLPDDKFVISKDGEQYIVYTGVDYVSFIAKDFQRILKEDLEKSKASR